MKAYNQDKLRLLKTPDYWWNIIMGALITLGIIIPILNIFFSKNNLYSLFFPCSIFCFFIVSYYQWKDDNLNYLKTNFSIEQNFVIVKQSLNNLKWEYEINSNKIDLTLNKYILKFLNPTIIIENNRILYNFKYHSTTKTGRLPFFFGISTYLKMKFEKELSKSILLNKANA